MPIWPVRMNIGGARNERGFCGEKAASAAGLRCPLFRAYLSPAVISCVYIVACVRAYVPLDYR